MKPYTTYIILVSMFVFGGYSNCHAQSPELADRYWEQAQVAKKSGRYLEAAQLHEKSAEAEKNSPSPRLADLSSELFEAANCYETIEQYDKALKCYKESLEAAKKLGKEEKVAVRLNNIGRLYRLKGQYDKALECYEETLKISRKLGKVEYISGSLNNIGDLHLALGVYDKALKNFEEALNIAKKHGTDDDVALYLHNIGSVYKFLGRYDQAQRRYEEALIIFRKLGREDQVGTCLYNIGILCWKRGEPAKALTYSNDALAILRKLGKESAVGSCLNSIGLIYQFAGEYDNALRNFGEALSIARKLELEDVSVALLSNIGAVYYDRKQYSDAIRSFKESIAGKEKLRMTATGNSRRDYLASQIGTYSYLISSYLRNHDYPGAFAAMETSRAKQLAERLAGSDRLPATPPVRAIQKSLPPDMAIISFANFGEERYSAVLIITRDDIVGAELDIRKLLASLSGDYQRSITQLLSQQRGLKIVNKSEEQTKKSQDKATTSFDDVVSYYRSLLTVTTSGINRGDRGLAAVNKSEATAKEARLDRMLHDFLLQPLAKQLVGIKKLIIIPDGVLSYLPFETLVDENNKYLVEKYTISYAQSMSVMEMLKKRGYPAGRKPMLAFGGAVYDELSYTADMITNEKQLLALAQDVNDTTRSKRTLGDAYASLGFAKWDNLPGTLSEVEAIAKTVKGTTIVTGKDVTENSVKQLSTNGELSKYKVIHFATHGIVVPEIPELSAIVLSQVKNQPAGDDGYLRMDKIEGLKMNADFVNLSACETGLGKIFGGEGVVGLTQSFLLAGANGLSASLWSVNDVSTSQFMVALYNLVEQKKTGYGDAITEIKRGFINGKFGEAYRSPYYWAPFVYYGKL